MTIEPAAPSSIARAARRLLAGALVAFPTETVYGLGADAENPTAVRRIFDAKGRPADHPVIVHMPDATQLTHWARTIPPGAQKLAQAFWPGPLTLILPRAAHVDDIVTGGQDSVGLRVPSHPVAQALLAEFVRRGGRGIAAPSANRFGHVSPTTAKHVADDLGEAVSTILDGGACPVGIESTIVAFTGSTPMLLRPGGLSREAIAEALGEMPRERETDAPRASGTLASHYAPRTEARLVAADALMAAVEQHVQHDESVGVLARERARPLGSDVVWIGAPLDAAGYARDLYANLRALDAAGVDAILIESPPDTPGWLAVRDRLARATHRDAADDT